MPLPPLLACSIILTVLAVGILTAALLTMRHNYEQKMRQMQSDHDLHIALIAKAFDRLNFGVNQVFYVETRNDEDVKEFLLRGLPSAMTRLYVSIDSKPPGLTVGGTRL